MPIPTIYIQLTDQNLTSRSLPTNYHEAEGFRNVLNKIRTYFGNPHVSIYENGYYDPNGLNDYDRINYFHNYFSALLTAVKDDGCHVTRYTIWSLLDNFGWQTGYEQLLGITEVDFNHPNRTRTPKLSSRWWRESISRRELQTEKLATSP